MNRGVSLCKTQRTAEITMGQAKLRGTPEQRKQAAIERQLSLRPKHIVCNNCKAELTEMQPIDISGMRGIDAAFAAHCPHCG